MNILDHIHTLIVDYSIIIFALFTQFRSSMLCTSVKNIFQLNVDRFLVFTLPLLTNTRLLRPPHHLFGTT